MGRAEISSYRIYHGARLQDGKRFEDVKLILWLKEGHDDPSIKSIWMIFDEAEMKTSGLGHVGEISVVIFFPPSAFADYYRFVQQEQSLVAEWRSDDSGVKIFLLSASGDLAGDAKTDLMAEGEADLQVPPPRS